MRHHRNTYRADQQLGTIETDASQYFDRLRYESNVKHGLGQINVTEMAGTLGHVPGTRLAPGIPVDHTLTRVHEPAELRPPALHGFGKPDTAFGHRHPTLPKEKQLIAITNI